MRLTQFEYSLPAELIAQRPLPERDGSRMLLLDRRLGGWEDSAFRSFADLLRGDELLLVNNARVLPARLLGRRLGVGSRAPGEHSRVRGEFLRSPIEVLLTRQLETNLWEALVRPGRKVRIGERIVFGEEGDLEAEVVGRGDYGLREVRLSAHGDLMAAIERVGHVPLPPYIDRPDEPADRERYQTLFARKPGAVAAPTAGLHFTPAILDRLRARSIEICEITLEVGLGTFQPIHAENVEDHKMHREAYEIPEATAARIEAAKSAGRPILGIGTTVVRALEDAARKSAARGGTLPAPGRAEADLFIYPGHEFRVVDQLLTNFHLPQSSLLVMVCAFAGRERVLAAYRHAVDARYRFYSYGDCMLIR